jgi:ubiquinone/menaquinone biosynthesis C-methylase UbiE
VRQDKVREHYDTIADVYDNHYDRKRGQSYHSHISDFVIGSLPGQGSILDIGCGTGLFVRRYEETGGHATGIDISRRMIQKARRRCPDAEFVVGTGEVIPFADNSFDGVSSLLVFTYLKHPDQMLSESFRVIRPGGSIAICTLGKKLLTRGIPAIYHISEKVRIRHVVMKNFGEHYYDEDEMRRLFADAGFTDLQVQWCSFAHINMIDPLFKLASRVEPFVEKRIPQLAYNICVSARKPEH